MKDRVSLKALLKKPGVLYAGGVGDGAGALLVEHVGYPLVFVSGYYVNYTRGCPDGTLSLTEMAARVGEIADRVSIPVIADGEGGFGDVRKVARTVQEFEKAGASAVHLEDMVDKMEGVVIPLYQMVKNIKVALNARKSSEFLIVARTDAVAPWVAKGVQGQDLAAREQDAFERCVAYAEAGADLIMPVFGSTDWLRRFGKKIPKPLLTLAPDVEGSQLEPMNVKIVAFSTQMIPRAHMQLKSQYARWLQDGRTDGVSPPGKMRGSEADQEARREVDSIIGVPAENELLAKYGHYGDKS